MSDVLGHYFDMTMQVPLATIVCNDLIVDFSSHSEIIIYNEYHVRLALWLAPFAKRPC
jgi:hypothetical protein